MKPLEFAQLIKTKYPDYKDIEDNLLIKRVLDKHPQYRSQVDFTPEKTSFLGSMAKGVGKTLTNLPGSVLQLGRDLGSVATETIPQTIANVAYNPKAIPRDIASTGQGLANLAAQGIANVAVQPIEKTMSDVGKYVQENPAQTVADVSMAVPGLSQTGLARLSKSIEKASTSMARRTLGLTKGTLKKQGALERANQVADMVLKENIIPEMGNPKIALERATQLKEDAGRGIAVIREKLQNTGIKSFNPIEVDDLIKKQLMPKLSEGAFAKDKRIVNEIRKTVLAYGGDDLDFKSAVDLTQKLQEEAGFKGMMTKSEAQKAKYYQKASGIVSDALDKSVERVAQAIGDDKILTDYTNYKQLYGKAKDAEVAFRGRVAAIESNNAVGLRTSGLAIGELIGGNLTGAGAAIVGGEALKRRGWGIAAKATRDVSKKLKYLGGTPAKGLYFTGRAKESK